MPSIVTCVARAAPGTTVSACAPVTAPRRYRADQAWLARGMHGTMSYMAADAHVHGRQDLPDCWPAYEAFPEMPLISISNDQRRPIAPPQPWRLRDHVESLRALLDAIRDRRIGARRP